jgi:hypothetical protein
MIHCFSNILVMGCQMLTETCTLHHLIQTSTWNSQYTTTPTGTFNQRQDQSQKQSQSGTCIAMVCKQTQSGSQGADQGQTQRNGQ